MTGLRRSTITTRVDVRTRRLAEVVAELEGVTLSAFTADAIQRQIKRTLGKPATEAVRISPYESAQDEGLAHRVKRSE